MPKRKIVRFEEIDCDDYLCRPCYHLFGFACHKFLVRGGGTRGLKGKRTGRPERCQQCLEAEKFAKRCAKNVTGVVVK